MRACFLGFVLVGLSGGLGCGDGDGGGGAAGTGGAGGAGGVGARGLVIQTTAGPVEGFDNESVHSYRGIPFAAPPIGALRWAPPSTPTPWTDTLDATAQGDVCVQAAFGGLPIPGFSPSEDCLFLNVDTPAEGAANEAGTTDFDDRAGIARGNATGGG